MLSRITLIVACVLCATSAMPFMNVRTYCRKQSSSPRDTVGLDCRMQCTPQQSPGLLCSFNLTEACHLDECVHPETVLPFSASSVMNTLPDNFGFTNMLKLLDHSTFRYQACLIPESVGHSVPLVHRDHCVACEAEANLDSNLRVSIMCPGFDRFEHFQSHENVVLALEISSQYSPEQMFTIGVEFYHLPNPHNRTIVSVHYIGDMSVRRLSILPRLFVNYL